MVAVPYSHQQCLRFPISPHPCRCFLFSGFLIVAVLIGVKLSYFIFWSKNIPLYGYFTVMNNVVINFTYKFLCGCIFSFLLGIDLRVELLDYRATLCLTFWGSARSFSKVNISLYTPPLRNVWGFQFFRIPVIWTKLLFTGKTRAVLLKSINLLQLCYNCLVNLGKNLYSPGASMSWRRWPQTSHCIYSFSHIMWDTRPEGR